MHENIQKNLGTLWSMDGIFQNCILILLCCTKPNEMSICSFDIQTMLLKENDINELSCTRSHKTLRMHADALRIMDENI